jgi:isocitrate/isopropylmalate dehydrogenase
MDAIFFGAVGWPATVPDHVSLWGSLLKFRREFDQYINLRPVRLFEGVPCPLAGRKPGDIDYCGAREHRGRVHQRRRRDVRRHRARDRDPGVGVSRATAPTAC